MKSSIEGRERTIRETITFRYPFQLPASDEPLPAGTYDVETTEQRLDSHSFSGWRRTMTTIVLQRGSSAIRQVTEVQPNDLAAALAADKER